MPRNSIRYAAAVLVVAAISSLALLPASPAPAQQPTVTRKILEKIDAPTPGYEVDLVAVEIPPGGREGRHTHPGVAVVYVQQGVVTLDYDGRPTKSYKPGETFSIEAGKIHEGRNDGKTTVKVLGTFVVPKGVPLTTQVK